MVACGCNSSAMASGASSSNPGASQPGATSNGGPVVKVAVGSFNFGVVQTMLLPDPWAKKHRDNFKRVCAKMVEQEKLDIVLSAPSDPCMRSSPVWDNVGQQRFRRPGVCSPKAAFSTQTSGSTSTAAMWAAPRPSRAELDLPAPER